MVKKKGIIILEIVSLIILLIIGVSYAFWQMTLSQESMNSLTTGCFKIEFIDNNPIYLGKAYPILDSEGSDLKPYEFTITNTCDSYASYQINLEVLNTTTLENLDFLKVMLDESSSLLTMNESVTTTLEAAKESYKLETGYLDAFASKTFYLRLWMDEDTPPDEAFMNKVFESKITVVSAIISNFDKENPVSVMKVTNMSNKIKVDASDSFDNEKIKYFYYSLDGENYIKTKESEYTFEVGNLSYGKGIDMIKTLGDSLEYEYIIYVKTEDEYGNISGVVSNTINSGFAYDETVDNNLRYIGENPNNYIDIGDRDLEGNIILWRIIGVMNNIKTSENDEIGDTRFKLVRAESIGSYSWDSSASNINGGEGVNEWSVADAKVLLNDYYYNSKSGQKCYSGRNNNMVDCDFSNNGFSEDAKNLVEEVLWNTGTNGAAVAANNIVTSKFYELERSNNTGKNCSSGTYCNDTVSRTTTWIGSVGLIYPSDYGYATSGVSLTNRTACLNTILYNWGRGDNDNNCYLKNWLFENDIGKWVMTPSSYATSSRFAYAIGTSGVLGSINTWEIRSLYPTLYLKANINILSGTGEENNPYVASL